MRATSVTTPSAAPWPDAPPDCWKAKPTAVRLSHIPTRPAIRSGRRPRWSMKAIVMKVASTLTAPIAQVVASVCASGVVKPAEEKMLSE